MCVVSLVKHWILSPTKTLELVPNEVAELPSQATRPVLIPWAILRDELLDKLRQWQTSPHVVRPGIHHRAQVIDRGHFRSRMA